jgi:hypothetical protein
MSKKKAPPNKAAISKCENERQPATHSNIVTKAPKSKKVKLTQQMICLTHFLVGSLNKLEALRLYNDTRLNTTISQLGDKGYNFTKKREPHANRIGDTVYFMYYALTPSSAKKTIEALARKADSKGGKNDLL